MIRLGLPVRKDSALNILCLGAHSDDIEIGCGGTIIRLLEEYPSVSVIWVVFSATGERSKEAKESANLFLANSPQKEIIIKDFRDGFFPYIATGIKEYFESLKQKYMPDLIFTHSRHDLHQDHRLISDLTWNTFRNNLILEYEVVKYDGDLGAPNFFVELSSAICRRKIDCIMKSFSSQQEKNWFTEDVFYSLLRIRGLEANAKEKYAEGFYSRKLIV